MLQGSGPPGLDLRNPALLVRNKGTQKNIVPCYLDLFWFCVCPPPVRLSLTGETNAPASPSLLMGSPAEESNNNSDLPPLLFQRTKIMFRVSEQLLWSAILINYAIYYLGFSQKKFPVLVQHVFDSFQQND